MLKPFGRNKSDVNQFYIDQVRSNGGTVVSYRDSNLYQAQDIAQAINLKYKMLRGREIHLQALKTDNVPMGTNKGKVLVQIGFKDAYTNLIDLEDLKFLAREFRQGELFWLKDFLLMSFPSIDKDSIRVLSREV